MPYMLDVITYGEAMAMFVATAPGPLARATQFTKRTAGVGLNVAVGLSHPGFRVDYVSRVGQDSLGEHVLETLAHERIDAPCAAVDPQYPTGFQLKARADEGSGPRVEYFYKGSAASRLSRIDYVADYVLSVRRLHLTDAAPVISASSCELAFHLAREVRAAGGVISSDPNLRPTLWPSAVETVNTLNALVSLFDWMLPGLAEGQQLIGYDTLADTARFYPDRGARGVVIRLGAAGVCHRIADGAEGIAGGVCVARVVDTVGVGDGFAVSVVSALFEGLSPDLAVARGNRIGVLAIQVIEDSEGLPTRAAFEVLEQTARMVCEPEPISNM